MGSTVLNPPNLTKHAEEFGVLGMVRVNNTGMHTYMYMSEIHNFNQYINAG